MRKVERINVSYRNYDQFVEEVRGLLSATAETKGYSSGSPDSENAVYKFVASLTDSGGVSGHAIGEAQYKLIRYAKNQDPTDLLKCSAWCFLLYSHPRDHSDCE